MKFTPVDIKTNKRLELDIYDMNIPRGKANIKYHVKEIKTGNTYTCKVKACSLSGCLCDAWILDY